MYLFSWETGLLQPLNQCNKFGSNNNRVNTMVIIIIIITIATAKVPRHSASDNRIAKDLPGNILHALVAPPGGMGARRGLAPFPGGSEIPHKWPGRARKGYRSGGPRPNRPVSPCFRGR